MRPVPARPPSDGEVRNGRAPSASGSVSYFNHVADEYATRYEKIDPGGRVLRYRRQLVTALLGEGPGRVLDIGCGPGTMTKDLLGAGWDPWGADASVRMIQEYSRRYPAMAGRRLVVADGQDMPVATGCFDAALCIGVIDRVADPARALSEIGRVLRTGGVVVVTFPNRSLYAIWRSWVYLPAVGAVKALGRIVLRREGEPTLLRPVRLWSAKKAQAAVERHIGSVVALAYYHASVLPSPLEELFPAAELRLVRRRISRGRRPWFCNGFVVKAALP